MKLSYYTINDLRLGHDPKGAGGWRLSRFLDWRDALTHYRSLPSTAAKSFGVSNGMQKVELLRCLPMPPDSHTGKDVLVLDFLALPLWNKEEGFLLLAENLVKALDICHCLPVGQAVPIHIDKMLELRPKGG